MNRQFLGFAMAAIGAVPLMLFASFIVWAHHMYAVAVTPDAEIRIAVLALLGGLLVVAGLRLALTAPRG